LEGIFDPIDTDHDGRITKEEFRRYFREMKYVFGSSTMALVVRYLTTNLNALQLECDLTVLPIGPLLLWDGDSGKPDLCSEPDALLTDKDLTRIQSLFRTIDSDKNGLISHDELAAVLGGAAQVVFDEMGFNADREIDQEEWSTHFLTVKQEGGTKVSDYRMAHFERTVMIQDMIKSVIDDTKAKLALS